MAKKFHFFSGVACAYGGSHNRGQNGEDSYTDDAGNEDLLLLCVEVGHCKR